MTDYKYNKEILYFNILVETSDTVRFKYMMGKTLKNGCNMLLTGETGVGKSVIINDFLAQLDSEKYVFT